MPAEMDQIPVIDISPLVLDGIKKMAAAQQIGEACRSYGFFYIKGHGVDEVLQNQLENGSKKFFSLPLETKMKIHMSLGGRAWRGYFAFGEELTGGMADQKEGLYFGQELPIDDPLVKAQVPLQGPNLFPDDDLPSFRQVIVDYQKAMTSVGQTLMLGIAISLGLPEDYFYLRYTREPTALFQIMNYPPAKDPSDFKWAISEHTDYGILTVLKQDNAGGLEIKRPSGEWIKAPPIPGTFVCNIGDMLDRMTGGVFKSTLHRVRSPLTNVPRLSFPFFFDPNFFADVQPIAGITLQPDDKDQRWDKESIHKLSGVYGDYLVKKVSRVFPLLKTQVLEY
ncbi:probable iron/ascorbate oxidoreductase DDB_G0283291 [Folsomia candida]|uniref:1-aminocyclopropane-1-carboxylate oxidase n=1 Tax=Folsomia candida TaxID=158441 RepID=A0A226CZY9_FOLCA|nr:probable iron/ascorbate oxidoreductase DDB_G0283291 [Folsomia candida]OXA37971.1 1-aminocyclopropane-1-carboxylate oxidase [Folsomia candida]